MLPKIDLASLFSSKARTKILRTLHYQSQALPLRHIALLADVPVFSIQRALNQLLSEKIIHKKIKNQYTLYSLNKNHPCSNLLSLIFVLEEKALLQTKAPQYHNKAIISLNFSAAAIHLFQKRTHKITTNKFKHNKH